LATPSHKLKTGVKAESLNIDHLQRYSLSLQVGVRDVQICITDKEDASLKLLEDYDLLGITSVNTRIKAIKKLFDQHILLNAGFWSNVKIAVKTHKFTLLPKNVFAQEAIFDYLSVNCEVRTKSETVSYYKHIADESVNVFAADKKLLSWIEDNYPTQNPQLIHQGSLMEGILKYDDQAHEKTMFCQIDKGILHVVVTLKKQLLYYNQFAVREDQDFLKFIMLVFKEQDLSQKSTKLVLWGNIKANSSLVSLLRKYIRNLSLGHRPGYLKTSFEFDEIPEHHYFDVMNIFLCD